MARRSDHGIRARGRHGLATLLAFVADGAVPLLPFLFAGAHELRFGWSIALTLTALFVVGAARGAVTAEAW